MFDTVTKNAHRITQRPTLVYDKGHKNGHCHQLCLLLVHFFCCQYLEANLKGM